MSTATAPARPSTHATLSRLTFGGLVRSEWIKLRSLRSTFWCYALIVLLNIGFALLVATSGFAGSGDGSPLSHDAAMSGATQTVTLGVNFTSLIAAVLGALVITGEYGTGMAKSTFTADPKRLGAVFAKAIVFGVVTFVVSLVSLVASALIVTPILSSSSDIDLDWADGTFWVSLIGAAGYLAIAGLIAFSLGVIIRASAGGIAAAIGLLFVAQIGMQIVFGITQAAWAANVLTFLPANAGAVMFGYGAGEARVENGIVSLDQGLGTLVVVGWLLVTGILAVILVKRRDV